MTMNTFGQPGKNKCLLFRKGSLFAGFPPQRPRFDPGSGQVTFVVDKVALGQVFSEYFSFPCQSSFHQLLHNHPHLSPGASTIGQKWPQYKGLSPSPLAIKKIVTSVICGTTDHKHATWESLVSTQLSVTSWKWTFGRARCIHILIYGSAALCWTMAAFSVS
jgi:hypothetical protein